MELSEVMRTTPATRSFTGEPVDDEVLHRILDGARFAPSGGNRQGWHVVVVRDRTVRASIAAEYDRCWREYVAHRDAGTVAFAPGPSRYSQSWVDLDEARATPAPSSFVDGLVDHPVLLVVAVELSSLAVLDHGIDRQSIVGGASIYPFCHNIMLGARDAGLGGVMTTALCRAEPAVADLLRIPDSHAVAAMIVLGHPEAVITRLRRDPVESFATVDRFDGAAFEI